MQRQIRSVETLPCKLTNDELLEKGVELSDKLTKIQQVDKEFDGVKKHYKSELEDLEKEVNVLKDQISTKREYRKIECSIIWDFDDKKKKIYVRNDTGEVVREDPISEFELQEELKIREDEKGDSSDAAPEDQNGPEGWPDSDTPFAEEENADTEEDDTIQAPEEQG